MGVVSDIPQKPQRRGKIGFDSWEFLCLFGGRLTGGGLAAAVEWDLFVRTERRLRQRFSDEDDKSFHFALTGPAIAVGNSVSYSRMLGGRPIGSYLTMIESVRTVLSGWWTLILSQPICGGMN